MTRVHKKNIRGIILPDFGDFLDIIEGETTVGFKYDGIGCVFMMMAISFGIALNLIFYSSGYLLLHCILALPITFILFPVAVAKKDYETFWFRRALAIMWPAYFAIVWFISGGVKSPLGYTWMALAVAYNTSLVTGKKSIWYVLWAILVNVLAVAVTLVFPQTLVPVTHPEKLTGLCVGQIVSVSLYIFYTFWFQRKIAENMQDKLTEYNEELIALNDEIENQTRIRMEMQLNEERMIQQKKQSEEMTLLLIKTLSDTIEAKDEYTRGHSNRVSEYAALIAEKMELPAEEVSRIKYAATLHDIGKIGVPDTILNKPSRLTDEEYAVIKAHSSIGADILQNIEIISYTSDIARHHHERYDGKGYPDGLKGDENSIDARIVAVADSFDAMNSERIYRKPLAREIVIGEIEKNSGTQFDPDVTAAFLELLRSGAVDEIDLRESGAAESEFNSMNEDAGKIISAVVNTMKNGNAGNTTDFLTGLMLRGAGEERIVSLMKQAKGALIFCDMDNLKPINDRFGHKAGDKALKTLGGLIGKYGESGACCRIGGDEFLLYLHDVDEKAAILAIENIISEFKNAVSTDTETSIATLSVGASMTTPADVYSDMLSKADKALYHVKQRGKAGYYIYHEENELATADNHVDLKKVIQSIESAGKYKGALDVEYRQFAQMYDYLHKVCERYEHSCSIVLVTLESGNKKTMYIDNIELNMHYMEMAIQSTIRNVDICTRYSSVQFLIVLLEAGGENVETIMNRIFSAYYKMSADRDLIPRYEVSSLAASV